MGKTYLKKACIALLAILATAFTDFAPGSNTLQQKAQQQHKNIAVYFCGSDWCTTCYQFKKSFLSNHNVDSVLNEHFIFYLADFPQRTKLADSVKVINEALAEKLNTEGTFPKLVIADENLNIKTVITKAMDFKLAYQKLLANRKHANE